MDADASSEQPPAPSSDNTRFLAEDIRIAHLPLLEDRLDVFSHAERCRLRQRFTHLYSTWMGHSLSDGEKREMEVHGFVHPGADHAVTQNCYWPPLPTSYILHHMGGWTEETFHDTLLKIPESQMSDICADIMELLPQWTPHLQEDGSFVFPWWLMAASNYASDACVLRSNEVQRIAQKYFRDVWPLGKSPIKDRLHGTLESHVERYRNNMLRVEALLPDLNTQVEELFEQLTCMAQMLGLYSDVAACKLCTYVD
ncbi:hypothetical protein BKA82DRAFT_35307 [Pisolithus tinctorius]|uniref:Uncharacterized protein n=1 Tax=Pisolithus tinctorius Marx 270 TaxID=870435 RepID=A0A0C3NF70_PISTI|nr:hypothetical protein BKA82DRAFT_35307 [Pisolithus tinctorius]KIN94163.1 hypothetical protein M404DRAFT_35307 [Pisolithus tinctorius Marx 270]